MQDRFSIALGASLLWFFGFFIGGIGFGLPTNPWLGVAVAPLFIVVAAILFALWLETR